MTFEETLGARYKQGYERIGIKKEDMKASAVRFVADAPNLHPDLIEKIDCQAAMEFVALVGGVAEADHDKLVKIGVRLAKLSEAVKLSPSDLRVLAMAADILERGWYAGSLNNLSQQQGATITFLVNQLARIQARFPESFHDYDYGRLQEFIDSVDKFAAAHFSRHEVETEKAIADLESGYVVAKSEAEKQRLEMINAGARVKFFEAQEKISDWAAEKKQQAKELRDILSNLHKVLPQNDRAKLNSILTSFSFISEDTLMDLMMECNLQQGQDWIGALPVAIDRADWVNTLPDQERGALFLLRSMPTQYGILSRKLSSVASHVVHRDNDELQRAANAISKFGEAPVISDLNVYQKQGSTHILHSPAELPDSDKEEILKSPALLDIMNKISEKKLEKDAIFQQRKEYEYGKKSLSNVKKGADLYFLKQWLIANDYFDEKSLNELLPSDWWVPPAEVKNAQLVYDFLPDESGPGNYKNYHTFHFMPEQMAFFKFAAAYKREKQGENKTETEVSI